MDDVLSFLPAALKEQVSRIPASALERMEELRIRCGRPVEAVIGGEPAYLPYSAGQEDIEQLLHHLSRFSLYTMEEELRRGYITISGGHRVGLAGKVILEGGKVKAIRDVSSFNIRVARQKIGAAEPLMEAVYDNGWKHTMIIGAPQSGKTTLLRDMARILSSGSTLHPAVKVGIVDERSEIAGCVHGVPQLEFGPRVDVLDSCPKAEGMMMMIRSMSPEVLIVDEIGRREDADAVLEAVNSGITLFMTTHGSSLEEIRKRPIIAGILSMNIFERFIELKRTAEGSRSVRVLTAAGNRERGSVPHA